MAGQQQPNEGIRKEGEAVGAAEAVAIRTELATHGEMLRRILALLEVEVEQDRPRLGDLLEALISEIGQNSRSLQTLTVAVAKLGRDLPTELVAAIDENLDVSRRAGEDTHRKNGDGTLPS